MKAVWTVVLAVLLLAGQAYAEEKASLGSEKDKISYTIGVDIGHNLKKQSIEVNPDLISQGIKDALSGGKLLMGDEEMQATKSAFRQEMMKKQAEQREKLSEKNKKEGEAFLAENKKKEGVKTLPSGLQYKMITEGKGKSPKATDTVTVNYRGTFIDGTEFDSSFKRGQPATFPVNGVIPGWTEALQLMKEGSKWQIFIPSKLAYGDKGAGGLIGPDATLIFEVELLSVKETPAKENPKKEK
ncbi:MAG: FKBP-type peptidyl-prolyl cis-trans isomerase [Nitrospirae bacterium]|nr:FKBP-type peptidyl-prolyl cis-trans isomerase [Nitrospirota bacterium]